MGTGEGTRGLTKRWLPRRDAPVSGSLIERVLDARQIGPEEADAYLNPSLKGMHDPGSLHGVDRAAKRILSAAESGEPIVIFGDYDVDGVTGTAVLMRLFRLLEAKAREFGEGTSELHRKMIAEFALGIRKQ